MAESGIVLFDLDGTLVRDDSFTRFLVELLFRRPVGGALSSLVAGPLFAIPWTRRPAVNLWLWFATARMPNARYEELVTRFAERHYRPESGRPIEVALTRVKEHQSAGHRVVVVTGSEERLAREICRVIGLDGVEVVGSTLVRRWGALSADSHCYGPEKLVRLRQAGHEGPFVCAYTDSSADLPLLLAAVERVLVRPRGHHRRRVTEQIADCSVLE